MTILRLAPPFALAVAVFAAACPALAQTPTAARPTPAATALARNAAAQERDVLDGVIAASLSEALSGQLGGRPVQVRLKHVDVRTTSLRDRTVSGQGEVRIDASQEWVGFRFNTLYDAILERAGEPELSFANAGASGRLLPNDARLVRQLDERVVGLLGEEFGDQRVRLQLDRVDTLETGANYLRMDASGIVDFGQDGTAPTRVEALYDRQSQTWLRVRYVLDPQTSGAADAPSSAGG